MKDMKMALISKESISKQKYNQFMKIFFILATNRNKLKD